MPTRVPVHAPVLDAACMSSVVECLQRGEISGNAPIVSRFEEAFARWLGVGHAIAVTSGTTSLRLALAALNVGPGDEVILPAMTFAPCADVVVHAGATPVFVDSEPERLQLDLEAVGAAIGPRTRVVMAVHAYGQTADLDALQALCDRRGVTLLEDSAQALGARCRDRAVGTIGRASCYSFYANKLLTTGEGGMIATDDADLAARARHLRNHGLTRGGPPYDHDVCGFNFRMPSLSAALGLAQIDQLDARLERRGAVATRYREGLAAVPGVRMLASAPWITRNAWWAHVAMFDPALYGRDAGQTAQALREEGVDTRPLYHPLHLHAPLRQPSLELPVCERLASGGLVLPSGNGLTDTDVDRVVAVIARLARAA